MIRGGIFSRIFQSWAGKRLQEGCSSCSKQVRASSWDGIFRPVRQPDWWQGDAKYHAPAYSEPVSELERRLAAGEFVVTSEISPPFSSNTDKLIETIGKVKSFVTALNFTDNASATPRMSSSACCQVALQYGGEPVLQISARNRSRSNLQSEVIGASALDVRNILCVTGDSAKLSPSPHELMEINDLDAIQMLWILRRMRDEENSRRARDQTPAPIFPGRGRFAVFIQSKIPGLAGAEKG